MSGAWPKTKREAEIESANLGYDTLLCITDKETFSGRSFSNVWCVGIPEDYFRIKNFINYEKLHGRKVMLWSKDKDMVEKIYSRLGTVNEKNEKYILNLKKTKYLCHSTTIESFGEILKDGELLSYSELLRRGKRVYTVRFQLKEPEDYLEYIHLCDCCSISSEIVVASRQYARINCDTDLKYNPGIRIYFDKYKMISFYKPYQDGVHELTVYKSLPLNLACAFIFPSKEMMNEFIENKNFNKEYKNKFYYVEGRGIWNPTEYVFNANYIVYKKERGEF